MGVGIVGMAYFVYGKRNDFYFAASGVGLMLYPYFVSTLTGLILIGIGLILLPFVAARIEGR
jgi:hypothetical protein